MIPEIRSVETLLREPELPDCVGAPSFDLERSPSGEAIGKCFRCKNWRDCLRKRNDRQ